VNVHVKIVFTGIPLMDDTMPKTAKLILFGPGLIGQTLVDFLNNAIERYRSPLQIIAICDSSGALIEPKGFATNTIHQLLQQKRKGIPFAEMGQSTTHEAVEELFSPETILVDTTNSDMIHQKLLRGVAKGCSLTMSNKKNLVIPWKTAEVFYKSPKVRFESTVCAGTPIVAAMQGLTRSLDEILQIEGCLSGTLNYICSQLDQGIPFAEAIQDAHDFGYTEPDPREDLSGNDVGRKALILARLAGWHLEMADIAIEKLYPESMVQTSKEEFFESLPSLTPKYQQLAHQAAAEAMSLRYIACIKPKCVRCELKAVAKDSEFGMLNGVVNKVSIHSRIHHPIPLTISGAGAGTEITALGLLYDILTLAEKII
jgi:homoserine dehydrogenase